MKRLSLITLCLLALLPLTAIAQVAGTWHGELRLTPAYSLPLVLHIAESEEKYTATLDSPEQHATGIPVDQVSYSPGTQLLKWSAARIGARYEGRLDGDEIKGNFSQNGFSAPLTLERGEYQATKKEPALPYDAREIHIPSGDIVLAGTLTTPREADRKTAVVLVAGSGPNDRDSKIGPHKPLRDIADHLTREGYTVLRYDKRGVGASSGSFMESSLSDFVTDAESALRYLREQGEYDRIGLIGHSEGGLIAQMIAAEAPEATDFIILLAAPGVSGIETIVYQNQVMMGSLLTPGEEEKFAEVTRETFEQLANRSKNRAGDSLLIAKYFDQVLPLVREEQRAETTKLVRSDEYLTPMLNSISMGFYKDFLRADPAKLLPRITCPILALNGSKDMQVEPRANLSAIKAHATASPGVTTAELEGLNHLFVPAPTGHPMEYMSLEPGFSQDALRRITDWLSTL